MEVLAIRQLYKSFDGGKHFAVENVNVSVQKEEIYALIGESGSGKTTLLRLIAGLETPDDGQILLNERVVTDNTTLIPAEKRKIGFVFQDYALFPHLPVIDNIAFGLSKKGNWKARVKEILDLVGLSGFEGRYPHELSGGQQQRVALARALAPGPELLLLDEPFSNLDTILKKQMKAELFEIVHQTKITAILVTHDTQDVLSLANTITILKKGKVEQTGTPAQLYRTPKTAYVSSLIGEVNLLQKEDLVLFGLNTLNRSHSLYGIRPDEIHLDTKSNPNNLSVSLVRKVYLGSHIAAYFRIPNGTTLQVNLRSDQFISANQYFLSIDEKQLLRFK